VKCKVQGVKGVKCEVCEVYIVKCGVRSPLECMQFIEKA